MGFAHSVGIRLLALVAALVGVAVVAQPAHAVEVPGVYDITTDRTIYPAAGMMTVSWRTVMPAGVDDGYTPDCTLTVHGVQQAPVPCLSGQAFTYPDSGFRGADTTNSSVTVTAYYAPCGNCALQAINASQAIQFDGGIPTAAVAGFYSYDTSTGQTGTSVAPTEPMRPGTPYVASLMWHDNLHVQSTSCHLERVSPLPAVIVGPANCGSSPSPSGTSAIFTTPSSSGTYAFVVDVTDPAGNTAQGRRQFTVDASPPVLAFPSGPAEGGATSATSIAWTSDETATYACWVGTPPATATLTTCSSPLNIAGLSDGPKQLQVQAKDGFGNSSITTWNFTIDRTKPTLTLNSPADGTTFTSTGVPYSVTASEPVRLLCSTNPDGGPATYSDSCSFGQTKSSWSGSLNLPGRGLHHYGFAAVDAAGNRSDPVTFTYYVKPYAALTWQSGPSMGSTVSADMPSWTWTTDAANATYECLLTPSGVAGVFGSCSSPYGAATSLPDGTYDFSVRTSGSDVTTSTTSVTFVVDRTTPVSGSVRTTGTSRVGSVMTVAGSWPSGVVLTYQWRRDGSPIPGATGATYRLVPADLKHQVSVTVTGTRGSHAVPVTTATVTVAPGILSSGRARMVGILKVGRRLTASAAPWTAGTTVRFQWFANGKKVVGATRATLRLSRSLAGKRIKVLITGSRAGYQTRVLTVSRLGTVHR
ncbi:MAG TPA: hypothetical protein VN108_07290 [Marmoricola sp.]|nr:hypothetical protein [Marmoricola sp.]